MSYPVKYCQNARGDAPVLEFILAQELPIRAKIIHSIELLITYGYLLTPPYMKKIDDHLFELRTSGKNSVRIFYTYKNATYYLLHAFMKKSQKTPEREIRTALDRVKDIL